ncbi:MAG: twin-arginine translocase TatA/TatE family subunit [Ginsengibacter sp.]
MIFFNAELLFAMPGGTEWVLILLVVLLFFGGRKIPELMRGIGKGVKEFNNGKENVKNEMDAGTSKKDKTSTKGDKGKGNKDSKINKF